MQAFPPPEPRARTPKTCRVWQPLSFSARWACTRPSSTCCFQLAESTSICWSQQRGIWRRRGEERQRRAAATTMTGSNDEWQRAMANAERQPSVLRSIQGPERGSDEERHRNQRQLPATIINGVRRNVCLMRYHLPRALCGTVCLSLSAHRYLLVDVCYYMLVLIDNLFTTRGGRT